MSARKSSMSHTKGPWQQSHRKTLNGSYSTEIYDSEGKTIATLAWYAVPYGGETTTNRHQNARRIVACVNALEGIPTECLEADSSKIVSKYESILELEELGEQRDALLSAIKSCREILLSSLLSEPDTTGVLTHAEDILREAIADAKVF